MSDCYNCEIVEGDGEELCYECGILAMSDDEYAVHFGEMV